MLLEKSALLPQLLVILRGKKTQGQVNRKLRYAYNQVSRWEIGKKSISWRDFIRFCIACDAPIVDSFRDCYSYVKDVENGPELFQHFLGNEPKSSLTIRLGISRSRLGRLVRCECEPTTLEILAVLDHSGPFFLAFLQKLTRGKPIPILNEQMSAYQAQAALFFRAPWISLICQALLRPDYKSLPSHSDEWLADATRLPLPILRSTLQEMVAARLIAREKKHFTTNLERFGPRGSIADRRRAFFFWNETITTGIRANYAEPFCRSSWDVFNLSDEGYLKATEHWGKFLHTIGSIIDTDEAASKKRTYIMCLNLFDAAKIPEVSKSITAFDTSD